MGTYPSSTNESQEAIVVESSKAGNNEEARGGARRPKGPFAAVSAASVAFLLLTGSVSPTAAQLPFFLNDCLQATNEDARLFSCRNFANGTSGTEAEKTRAAIEASQILRARGELDMAEALLNVRRSSPELDGELGMVWFELGDLLLADFYFEMAVAAGLVPDGELRARAIEAAYWYGEELQYSQDDPVGAVEAYGRALALDPDHVFSLLGRAEALQKLDRHHDATVDLDRAIALGADWTAHLLRARSRQALGDVDGATADFRRVLDENPEQAAAREALDATGARP